MAQFGNNMYATMSRVTPISAARMRISTVRETASIHGLTRRLRKNSAHTKSTWQYVPMYQVVGLAGRKLKTTFTPKKNGR